MVAANKAELSNVVIVISDLSATAYASYDTGVMAALNNLQQESNRSALFIEPVATQGDEVFHILRTRLFESLPDRKTRQEVGLAYAEAVKKAKQMELTAATPASFSAEILDSYPFHFSLRDLYGRFKENPNFQQTRGLLRMMRVITANLWETKKAESLHLIHPYDIDLNDPEVFTEFDRINQSLSEAVRADIANSGRSHAEELDVSLKARDATDAAKLIYVASLSLAQKAVIGLRDSEIVAWLCAPERDIDSMHRDVLEVLPNRAWYLHMSLDGRLYFKNIQNLAARLYSMVGATTKENRVQELRRYLTDLFEPKIRDLYQEIKVLAPIDEITISQDRVTLILADPYPGATADIPLNPEWVKFFGEQTFQNRMLFLTGDRNTMEEVLKNAAYLRAVETVLREQAQDGVSPKDPQAQEAVRSKDKYLMQLRSAVQQTFSTIIYPSRGKIRHEFINFNFESNQYDAEAQIRKTLAENQKFSQEGPNETWIRKTEDRLFDGQNPVPWNEIKKRAAVKPEWQMHHPGLLDDIKTLAIRLGKWKLEGNSVRKGPFDKEPTQVTVNTKSVDQDTGEAILQIIPEGGTKVFCEIGDAKPTSASREVKDFHDFRTRELKLSFICVDDGPDPRPTGPHTVWTNKISLKGRSYSQGSDTFFQIFSIPPAPVRYTTDGSDPLSRGVPYNGDFIVPPGTKIVAAVAEKDGVVSSVVNFPVDAKPSDNIRPDEAVDWHCRKRYQNLPISEGFQVLEYAREFRGGLSAVMITVVSADTDETLMYTLPDGQFKTPEEIIDLVEKLTALVPRANLTLTIGEISFSRGQDLLDWVKKNRLDLDYSREVRQ